MKIEAVLSWQAYGQADNQHDDEKQANR
jgi:hypothetical protein